MPTQLDRALQSKAAFLGIFSVSLTQSQNESGRILTLCSGFAGLVSAVAAWTIWGGSDVFPKEPDPSGGQSLMHFAARFKY